jgi:fluoride ion exporter CrcB/FEX
MKPSNVSEFALAIGMLSCFSILGTLARVGCDWIFKSSISILAPNDSPIGTDFMANILGSFIMGALDKLKPRLDPFWFSSFCDFFQFFAYSDLLI